MSEERKPKPTVKQPGKDLRIKVAKAFSKAKTVASAKAKKVARKKK